MYSADFFTLNIKQPGHSYDVLTLYLVVGLFIYVCFSCSQRRWFVL